MPTRTPSRALDVPNRTRPAQKPSELTLAAIALGTSAAFPLGVLGGLVSLTVTCALLGILVMTPFRRLRATVAVSRERWVRRNARAAMLPFASPESIALAELTHLVDQIERQDPELARRLALDELLDRHVTIAIAHRRAMQAALMSDHAQLERVCNELREKCPDPRHLALYERRLASQVQCEARAEQLGTELSMIEQLIRLAAQRALCPDAPPGDDLFESRLLELDALDAAKHELADEVSAHRANLARRR